MIISVHIPKTAGTSFGERLEGAFGSRLLRDYGDFPEVGIARPMALAADDKTARRIEISHGYDVIHGHFRADKYADLFSEAKIIAFFRDPYHQAISGYDNAMRRPDIDHPVIRMIHAARMSLVESVAAFPNPQVTYLGRIDLGDLAMIGLTEQYSRSVALFEATTGRKLPPESSRKNVNRLRPSAGYEVTPELRNAVTIHRGADVELYNSACERFERLCARYGV